MYVYVRARSGPHNMLICSSPRPRKSWEEKAEAMLDVRTSSGDATGKSHRSSTTGWSPPCGGGCTLTHTYTSNSAASTMSLRRDCHSLRPIVRPRSGIDGLTPSLPLESALQLYPERLMPASTGGRREGYCPAIYHGQPEGGLLPLPPSTASTPGRPRLPPGRSVAPRPCQRESTSNI